MDGMIPMETIGLRSPKKTPDGQEIGAIDRANRTGEMDCPKIART
jgi:hypothetical protein